VPRILADGRLVDSTGTDQNELRWALTGLAITAPLVLPQPHQHNSSAAADVTLHVMLDLVSGGARLQSLSPGQRWAL